MRRGRVHDPSSPISSRPSHPRFLSSPPPPLSLISPPSSKSVGEEEEIRGPNLKNSSRIRAEIQDVVHDSTRNDSIVAGNASLPAFGRGAFGQRG